MSAPQWRTPSLAYSRRTPAIEEHHRRTIAEVLREVKEPSDPARINSGSYIDSSDNSTLLVPVQLPKAHFYGTDGQRLVEALREGVAEQDVAGKVGKGLRACRSEPKLSSGGWRQHSPGEPAGSSRSGREQPLFFSSSFECGNLLSARLVQVGAATPESPGPLLEYELDMESDTNTTGKSQWFYFCCSNTTPCSVIFRITNFRKKGNLYKSGMQPHVYSSQTAAQTGSEEWDATCCSEVSYAPNKGRASNGKALYTLSFRYDFKYAHDNVFFAMHTPYSFSMLRSFLAKIAENPKTSQCVFQDTLCRTSAGVQVPLLLVTNGLPPADSQSGSSKTSQALCARKLADVRRKPAVVLIARQHPGEVVSSWVMSGLIRFLISSSPEAVALRDRFCFHIVPMVNVDGVIHGNSRCTLMGYDPNRCWANPSPAHHPEISALRDYLSSTQRRCGAELFVDVHGHSQRTGAFFYGCCPREVSSALFPKLASLGTRDVDFDGCRWRFGKDHNQSARAVAHNECGVRYSYTLETSFFGERVPRFASVGDSPATQARLLREVVFSPARSESIGCTIGRAMLRFFRLEAGIKAFILPPRLPATEGEDVDPYTRGGFETFDGSEEQVLPWLTMDKLRLAHADFTLAELEAQGTSCLSLRSATSDVEGDDVPASDSDCEEDSSATAHRQETALESDLGRIGTSGSGTSASSGKGTRRSHGQGRRSGSTRKTAGEESKSGSRSSNRRSASTKYLGSDPTSLDTAHGRTGKATGGRSTDASVGLELSSEHLDGNSTDVTMDCSGWGALFQSLASPASSNSRPCSSAGLCGNSRPNSRSGTRRNSFDSSVGPVTRAADLSETLQAFLEGSNGMANNSSPAPSAGERGSTSVSSGNQRPVTRRPRILQGSPSQPGSVAEAAKLVNSLSCAPSSWVDPPLSGANFPAFMSIDEHGQVTYLNSPTNSSHDGCLLPRLHVSGVPSGVPSPPSPAGISAGKQGSIGPPLLDAVDTGVTTTRINAAHPSTPSRRKHRASSTGVLMESGRGNSVSLGAALGAPAAIPASGGQRAGGGGWPSGVFLSKLQRKCRGVGAESQTVEDEADSLLKRGLWDRWIAR